MTCAHGNPRDCPACLLELALSDDVLAPGIVAGGRFRIVERLGRGGMGEVYRADDLKLGHAVALKFVDASDATLREVRVGREIAHPNVCRIYDIVDVDDAPAIVMELIDGRELAVPQPRARALEIARDVCAGLEAIHEKGIAHGDLKPANVMIDARGRARITDFGLARLWSGGLQPAEGGTRAYMAPEHEVTPRADLYALGVLLRELLGADLPVLRRCVDPDPSRRPDSARAVLAGIEDEIATAAERAVPLTAAQTWIVVALICGAAAFRPPAGGLKPAAPPQIQGTAYIVLLTAALAAGAVMAWRNRLRVDRRTAARTALLIFVCRALAGVLARPALTSIEAAATFASALVASSLFLAAEVWLAYVALEPYVRRTAPDALVSWARLLRGRVVDGLVARDLLLGLFGGLIMRVAAPLSTPFFYAVARSVFYALFGLLLLVLLRLLTRRWWAASMLWLAAVGLTWNMHPGVLVVLILLQRLGLLAAVVAIAVYL